MPALGPRAGHWATMRRLEGLPLRPSWRRRPRRRGLSWAQALRPGAGRLARPYRSQGPAGAEP